MDDAEDGRVGADGQRQGEHGDNREGGGPAQGADRERDILAQLREQLFLHVALSSSVIALPAVGACLLQIAELAPGFEVLATPGHTRGHQSVLVDGTDFIAAQAAETIDEISPALLAGWVGGRAPAVERIFLSHDSRVWGREQRSG